MAGVFTDNTQRQTAEMNKKGATSVEHLSSTKYFLCVDGGGSSCTAVLINSSGVISVGEAGPCNVSTIGVNAALAVISSAVNSALSSHEDVVARKLLTVPISSAWIALAGYDRPSLAPLIGSAISEFLDIPLGLRLIVSTDIDLLSIKADKEPLVKSAIVLVAGTGSIAMSYTRKGHQFVRTARIGGWGPLLGDEGSGFAIGKEALRIALRTSDITRQKGKTAHFGFNMSPLSERVFEHFKKTQEDFNPEDLLSNILAPCMSATPRDTTPSLWDSPSTTRRIARVAQVVLSLAESDDEAKSILQRGASNLVEMVVDLLRDQSIKPASTALILAGGVLKDSIYNGLVREDLLKSGIEFRWVMNVETPALEGARWLASQEMIIDDQM